jgi:hypothetical protein
MIQIVADGIQDQLNARQRRPRPQHVALDAHFLQSRRSLPFEASGGLKLDAGLILTDNVRARRRLGLRASRRQAARSVSARASPKRERDRHGIDVDPGPL